ncbi:outer membrane protein assembly factor BamD [Spiribacter sp. 1M153]|jgi:outer membrane protein assembly factor BamD|uniref:outer membrane protein assembly factor BamD n=1 Tax=Spiribacter roseus TaxID=1855875 RepID=UPI00349F10AD
MTRFLAILLLIGLLAGCAGNTQTSNRLDNTEAAALYEAASEAAGRNDWQTAISELESLQAQYPFGLYATQAQLDIIHAYYQAGEVASTVAAAERFRRINPRHRAVPYSWYMQGLALEEKNRGPVKDWVGINDVLRDPVPRRQAFAAYTTLVEDYPDSEYTDMARGRLDVLYAEGAEFQLSVARFYADRDAWVAAARRAITVIEAFEGTAAVKPATDLLGTAYQRLGLDALADGVRTAQRETDRDAGDRIPDTPTLYEEETMEVPPAPTSEGPSGGSGGMGGPMGGGL